MSCKKCYLLNVGSGLSGYTLVSSTSGNNWFDSDGIRIVDTSIIADLFSAIDSEVKQANAEILCTQSETIGIPYGETFVDQTDVVTPPTGATGITIKCEPDSVDRIEISFDGGTTYPFNMSQGESNTWDNVDLTNMFIRPVDGGTATFDIHGEYK